MNDEYAKNELVKNYKICYLHKGINLVEPNQTDADETFEAISTIATILTLRLKFFLKKNDMDKEFYGSKEFKNMSNGVAIGFGKYIDAYMSIYSYKCINNETLETTLIEAVNDALEKYDNAYKEFFTNYLNKETKENAETTV